MDFGITGKRALVCAASKGLGKAIAFSLARERVRLVLCARDERQLEKVADVCSTAGSPEVLTQVCDLTQYASRQALVEYIGKTLGAVDIVIHNVGGPKPSSAQDTSLSDWQHGFEQLFPGIAHLNSAFLPAMKAEGWGRIVAVTSLSVMEPIANLAVSNAMRAAVTGMLKTLADEVAESGITVNCVAPGLIHTDRTDELMQARIKASGQSQEQYMKEYLKLIPMRRLGTPDEFAAVVSFLCSQSASYVTGSTICVDGGKRRSIH